LNAPGVSIIDVNLPVLLFTQPIQPEHVILAIQWDVLITATTPAGGGLILNTRRGMVRDWESFSFSLVIANKKYQITDIPDHEVKYRISDYHHTSSIRMIQILFGPRSPPRVLPYM
jgi:hypothetical protein